MVPSPWNTLYFREELSALRCAPQTPRMTVSMTAPDPAWDEPPWMVRAPRWPSSARINIASAPTQFTDESYTCPQSSLLMEALTPATQPILPLDHITETRRRSRRSKNQQQLNQLSKASFSFS